MLHYTVTHESCIKRFHDTVNSYFPVMERFWILVYIAIYPVEKTIWSVESRPCFFPCGKYMHTVFFYAKVWVRKDLVRSVRLYLFKSALRFQEKWIFLSCDYWLTTWENNTRYEKRPDSGQPDIRYNPSLFRFHINLWCYYHSKGDICT